MKTLPNDGVSADIENLDSLNDEALARLAQNGSSDAEHTLVVRFMPLVRIKARPYFLIGADHSDLVQEGSIGLFSAIRDYDCEKHTSFRTYAEVCIGNNIIAAIKRATRKKHFPLNSYISLDKPVFFDNPDDEARCLGDSINSIGRTPFFKSSGFEYTSSSCKLCAWYSCCIIFSKLLPFSPQRSVLIFIFENGTNSCFGGTASAKLPT